MSNFQIKDIWTSYCTKLHLHVKCQHGAFRSFFNCMEINSIMSTHPHTQLAQFNVLCWEPQLVLRKNYKTISCKHRNSDNVLVRKHTYCPSGLTLASKFLRFLQAPMLSGNLTMPAAFKANISHKCSQAKSQPYISMSIVLETRR